MHPKLRDTLDAVRPAYHKLPLTLTLAEIDDAVTTIRGVFDMYELDSFRTVLLAIRNAALQADNEVLEVEAHDIVFTTDQVIKLVECIWLLYQRPDNDEYRTPFGEYGAAEMAKANARNTNTDNDSEEEDEDE